MIIETITLDADLCVTLHDQTSHYFGGYFHVKVWAWCDIPLKPGYFEHDDEFRHAVEMLGTCVRFERVLGKMAVPASGLESARSQLIRSFHETAVAYLSTPDFAPRFVRNEYHKCVEKTSRMRSIRE